ncbi:MAG TPA: hypothetical protein VGB18_01100 [Candidatus Thermoplasmatota archaeon]
MAGEQFIPFLIFLVAFAAIAWFVYQHEKKRAAEFAALAESLGLHFEKRPGHEILDQVGFLDAMPRGNSRRAKFLLHGTYRDLDVRIFQYTYQTGSGKNQQTHSHTVAWARVPATWPGLTIVPEHVGHKLFDALGGDDIDFESDEFSRRFWVRCGDRKFAYDVIHGRTMEHIMAPGWQRWELKGPFLTLWENRGRLRVPEVRPALDRLAAFWELLPSFRRPGGIQGGPPATGAPTFAAVTGR